MPKAGDRVIVAGTKIGNPARHGTLIGTVGPLINVRWEDGSVSLFKPGAGSVSFESGTNGGGGRKAAAKPAAARAKAAPKAKAGKLAAPAAKKKAAAKKPAAKAAAKKKPAAKKKR